MNVSSDSPTARFRFAALAIGVALVAGGCGGSSTGDDTAVTASTTSETDSVEETTVDNTTTTTAAETTTTEETTTSAATKEPVDAPTIEILDQGAEPRVELRYEIADGVYNARISQIQSLSQTVDGQLVSEIADLETLIEVELTARAVNDGYEFSALYTDVGMGEGTDPAVAEATMEQMGQLIGSAFVSTIDQQGYVLDQAYQPPAGSADGDALQALMESIASQNQFASPLPTEAMGVGGSWKQTQSLTLNGIAMVQESVFTITSIDGSVITLDVTGTQVVPPGPIEFPGLPDTVEVTIESWDVTTTGEMATDLTRPFSTSSVNVSGTQVIVGEGTEAFRLEQELANVSTITPVG